MADASKGQSTNTLFSKFLNIVGLLVAALFFSGWIYRWAYYDYFQLDVNSLDFSFESFLIVPIQVFFGSPTLAFRTIRIFCITALAIYSILWLLRNLEQPVEDQMEEEAVKGREFHRGSSLQRNLSGFARLRKRILANRPLQLSSFRLLEAFVNELVIILTALIILFWYTQHRGVEDAQRDAFHCTSKLPEVTFVAPVSEMPIVRPIQTFDKVPNDTDLKNFGIIGDINLFDELLSNADNDLRVPTRPQVWRLLQEGGGWLYMFQALSQDQKGLYPAVLGLRISLGKQVMILKPFRPGEECSNAN